MFSVDLYFYPQSLDYDQSSLQPQILLSVFSLGLLNFNFLRLFILWEVGLTFSTMVNFSGCINLGWLS